jgi:hypothetical protein
MQTYPTCAHDDKMRCFSMPETVPFLTRTLKKQNIRHATTDKENLQIIIKLFEMLATESKFL